MGTAVSHRRKDKAGTPARLRQRSGAGQESPTMSSAQNTKTPPRAAPGEGDKLKNWEVVVYALYLAGGVTRAIHTEEVALKCFGLAPDAFSWIRFPQ